MLTLLPFKIFRSVSTTLLSSIINLPPQGLEAESLYSHPPELSTMLPQTHYILTALSVFFFLIDFCHFFFKIFWCGQFLKSLLNLLQYCFCFIFWFFDLEAYWILAPQPRIEPVPPALEGEVLTLDHQRSPSYLHLCNFDALCLESLSLCLTLSFPITCPNTYKFLLSHENSV